jgi:hypothetical protein
MANTLYEKGRQKFLEGGIAWLTDNIKCVLVDVADYTVNLGSHEFISDVPGAAIVATSANFSGKTSTAGVADANDITFTSVSGDQSEALIIYKDTGVASTSPLIAYIDTANGLPFTPVGGDISIQWDNGSNKIFRL